MILRVLNGQSKTITSAAIVIGSASLVSRLLGILRDRILASQFGAGDVLDMYYAAFRIPDFVFNLLILGALSAGFIPVFVKILKGDSEQKAWMLANGVLNLVVISLLIICGFLVLLSPYIVPLIAPGFSKEKIEITINLTRIMFLSPLFLGISAVFGGILQSMKRFFVYSLAPIVYNIGIMIGALFFVPIFGIYGLAYGVALGAFLHMIIQYPTLRMLGFHYRLYANFRDPGIREILKLMVPRTLSLAISQINLLIITVIGSTLAVGSIAIFNLANNLQSFPLGIFAISFSIAAFPTLTGFVATKEKKKFVQSFSQTVRQILFFMIPASVLLLVLRAQVVRIILGGGLFDWQDTILTMDTLGMFTFSLFAQGLIFLLIRSFYALHDSKTPFFIGLISTTVNIILSLYFSRIYGVLGLALSFSLSNILQMALLWLFLKAKIGYLDERNIIWSLFKISTSTFTMALAVQATKTFLGTLIGTETFFKIVVQGLGASFIGTIVFTITALLLRTNEMYVLIQTCNRKIFKVKAGVDIGQGMEV